MQRKAYGADKKPKPGTLLKTQTPAIYRKVGAKSKPYVVVLRVEGGQQKRAFRTLDDARRWKSQATAARDAGELPARSSLRFRDYLTEWIDSYQGNGKSSFRENTRKGYRFWLAKYAHAYFPMSLKLTDVSHLHMAHFVKWLAEQGLAEGSIRNATVPIRSALAEARRTGLIKSNPADKLAIPKQTRREEDDYEPVKALSREQLRALLAMVPKPHTLFIELIASTGLRISEAIALQRRDFDLEGSSPKLKVRRAIVEGRTDAPKSKHGKRSVALPPPLVFKLREQLSGLEEQALAFPSENGTPLNPNNLRWRVVKPLMQEIGAPWAGFHALRHTYASIQLADGCNVVALSRALGHHSAAFTLSTYAHLLPGEEAPALDLEGALGTPTPPDPWFGSEVAVQASSGTGLETQA